MVRATLRWYSLIFLAAGVCFVGAESQTLRAINWAGSIAHARALPLNGPTLWLGLAGSLMTVLAFMTYRLAEEPGQDALWDCLLLSKAVSSGLFLAFAVGRRNPIFLGGALVDGAIWVHLLLLRVYFEKNGDALEARLDRASKPFYEVWFARVNDPNTKRALWVRYCVTQRGAAREGACWAVFFDPASGRAETRRWTGIPEPSRPGRIFGMGPSGIEADRLSGAGSGVAWNLRMDSGGCGPFHMVPAWFRALGLSRSGYESAAPAASFHGTAELDGKTWDFQGAPGSLGHVWGERFGRGWWWAHAVFRPEGRLETALELLSAPGPLGRRLTSACLWHAGRLYSSNGPARLLRNRSSRDRDRWTFSIVFRGVRVEGECSPGLSASLEYEDPGGRRLVCRNSKISPMRLKLSTGRETIALETRAAAVEFVEAPS